MPNKLISDSIEDLISDLILHMSGLRLSAVALSRGEL
jgi:hypothetical protein